MAEIPAHRRPALWLCLGCALTVVVPLWTHRWLPIQDLPQHLAALRVVHEIHFGGVARGMYTVDLWHTQYVLFYLLGDLLACLFPIRVAGLVVVSAYFVGTVGGTYSLARALDRDPRLSLLTVPLLTNVLFVEGLIQFLFGIPLMLFGWSLALRNLREWRKSRAIGLAIVAVLLFYAHVVVFGVFVLGVALLAPVRSPRALARYSLPLAPSALACIHWALFTRAGAVVRDAMTRDAGNRDLWPFEWSFHGAYSVTFNSFQDGSDERLFAAAMLLAVASTALARVGARSPGVSTARWLLIPLASSALYVLTAGQNGLFGHIRERFSLLAILTLVPALRMPAGILGHLSAGAMVLLSLATARSFDRHCERFQVDEVGDFDRALAAIPPNERVAGLMFWSGSTTFTQNPFLQYAAYYLVEKGGAVTFSFAGFPHWVYAYRPHEGPPGGSPAPPLWEWRPSYVPPREELAASYDYVLTRGPGFDPPADLFVKTWEDARWAVWRRTSSNERAADPQLETREPERARSLSLLAGTPGGRGDLDGVGAEARIGLVGGMARAGDALIFADMGNGTIRRFEPSSGAVETLASLPVGADGRPSMPVGVAYDGARQVFVAHASGHAIYALDLDTRRLTLVAGQPAKAGSADGALSEALFDTPTGLAFDGASTLYVADTGNRDVRRIDLQRRTVSTLATGMLSPWGVCFGEGGLFVSDQLRESVLKVDPRTGTTEVLAGMNEYWHGGTTDGPRGEGRLLGPRGLTCSGDAVFVADHGSDLVRRIEARTGDVRTIAGRPRSAGARDGDARNALFDDVETLLDWGDGRLYVGDAATLRLVRPADSRVETVAGAPDFWMRVSEHAGATPLTRPDALEYAPAERAAYVAGCRDQTVSRVTLGTGGGATVAGRPFVEGFADGFGAEALFSCPSGLAFDTTGNLVVADSGNHALRRVETRTGRVETLAGKPSRCGNDDGPLESASFCEPAAISYADGALLVADAMTSTIRRVDLSGGLVTTVAGEPFTPGEDDGAGRRGRLLRPVGLAYAAGYLFVADTEASRLRRLDVRTGKLTTLAGFAFDHPAALAPSGDDALLVTDHRGLYRLAFSPEPTVTRLIGAGHGLRLGSARPTLSLIGGAREVSPDEALVIDQNENALLRLLY